MGTRRQEPWQFDETTIDAVRKTVKLRYRFIPYIYDLAHECEKTGSHRARRQERFICLTATGMITTQAKNTVAADIF